MYKPTRLHSLFTLVRMSFYLTLPSSVKLTGIQDKNTNGNYITRLERPLHLNAEEWEVGLAEIILPSSWFTIGSGRMVVSRNGINNLVIIRSGQYSSFVELTNEIHRVISDFRFDKFLNFFYDSVRHKVYMINREEGVKVKIEGDLANVMGFEADKEMGKGVWKSVHAPDIQGGNGLLYIYSSLVAPRAVGNVLVSLLRVITPSGVGNHYSYDHVEFKKIHYLPINNTTTDLVEIDIRQDDGKPVSFSSGKVVLTVHFRRKT